MSLSEKAAQLDALAEGQDVGQVLAGLQQAKTSAEKVGQQASGIIGDLPAGNEAHGVWQQVMQKVEETQQMAAAAAARLGDIATQVRQAGSGI